MDLDQFEIFKQFDRSGMIDHINQLPAQLLHAWEQGMNNSVDGLVVPDAVIVAGMGGSAIGADLVAGYISDVCRVPVMVHRDYDLPAWAGRRTLVVLSSHSGNTEETLSAFVAARNRKCSMITISKGGELTRVASEAGMLNWTFQHSGQPRSAVGLSFGLLLALFERLGLIPEQENLVVNTVKIMEEQQKVLLPEVLTRSNPAKRLAGQLFGRDVVILGSGCLVPVARRWKGQINELAKAWAQMEQIPEANHNTLAGIYKPQDALTRKTALFLRGACDHPANRLRADMTREIFMLEAMGTDCIDAKGDNALANIWSLLHFGDYVAYYLAAAYQIDPTPVEIMEDFKRALYELQA